MASGKGWGRKPNPVFMWDVVNVQWLPGRCLLFSKPPLHLGNQPRCSQISRVGSGAVVCDQQASHSVPTALPLLSALQSGEASLFEVNIRYIGGLLSAFYLTGEEVSWYFRHLDLPAWKGLGRTSIPSPHFPTEEAGSKRTWLPTPPTSVMPPATSSVWCFYIVAPMVVNSLRTTTRSAHHPGNSLQGVQPFLGSVWACRVLGWLLQVLVHTMDGAKTIVLPFLPRGPSFLFYTPQPPFALFSGPDTSSRSRGQ